MPKKRTSGIDLPYPAPGDRLTQEVFRTRDGRVTYCTWKVIDAFRDREEDDPSLVLKPMRIWQELDDSKKVVKPGTLAEREDLPRRAFPGRDQDGICRTCNAGPQEEHATTCAWYNK